MRLYPVKEDECCGSLIPNDEEFCKKYLEEHPGKFGNSTIPMRRKISQYNDEIIKDFMIEYMYKIYLQEHKNNKMNTELTEDTIELLDKSW